MMDDEAGVFGGADATGEVVDAKGREYTSAVKKDLLGRLRKQEERIKTLEAQVAALASRPAPSGLDEKRVNDHVWSFAPTAVYAALERNDAGLVAQITRVVGAAIEQAVDRALRPGAEKS